MAPPRLLTLYLQHPTLLPLPLLPIILPHPVVVAVPLRLCKPSEPKTRPRALRVMPVLRAVPSEEDMNVSRNVMTIMTTIEQTTAQSPEPAPTLIPSSYHPTVCPVW